MDWGLAIVQSLLTGLITGAAAYGAIRTELKYLRRDVDSAHKRISTHEERYHPPSSRK